MYGLNGMARSLTLCCCIIGLGSLTELSVEGFGNIFSSISLPKGKSLGELARQKIEGLHVLRSRLEKKRLEDYSNNNNNNIHNNAQPPSISTSPTIYSNSTSTRTEVIHGNESTASEKIKTKLNAQMILPGKPIELRTVPFPGMWNSLRSVFAIKKSRDGFLSRILPKSEVLRKIIRMRNDMDPSLRDYLTSRYNNFISKLEPVSDKIGVPGFVLRSMKISSNQDLHWYYIEKLLERASVEDLIHSIPDFSSLTASQLSVNSNSLSTNNEPIQSRIDDDLISDQEPEHSHIQSTGKVHKKKYPTYGIKLGNRRTRPNKGEPSVQATVSTIVGPDRTGYEYSAYADQYGLYGHDSYDTYGKGYDDYSHKGYGGSGTGTAGHSAGHNIKGYANDEYGTYKAPTHKGGDSKGQTSASYGQSTYYTPKSYGGGSGHSGGGYGGGGHGSGGGYGGGGGGGGGHGMMGGFLDPFSILGTLAFLTYLGLLFQQSMNANMANTSGRAFPHHIDPVFGRRPKSVELTVLSFDSDIAASSSSSSMSTGKVGKNRHIRSLEKNFLSMDFTGSEILEDTWKAILTIEKTENMACRHEQLCQLIQDIIDTDLMNVFQDILEKREADRDYLGDLYHRATTSQGIICHMELCHF